MFRSISALMFIFTTAAFAASNSAVYHPAGSAGSRVAVELDLIGNIAVQYNDTVDNNVRIKAQEVRNARVSGTSGQVSLQLWAFFEPFRGQGGAQGYLQGQVNLGTLVAGASVRNIDQTVAGSNIPADGTYYSTLLLVENNGSGDFFYDYLNFSGTLVYSGGKVDVVAPPRLFVSTSTDSAKQGAPYSFTFSSGGALPQTYSATGIPTGLALKNTEVSIDESGVILPVISGTPKTTGTFPITLKAENNDGSDTFTLTLTVQASTVNVPPTVISLNASPTSVITGQRVSFTAGASDPENVPLTFSWDFKDGTTLAGASVFHTFTVAGSYAVVVSVSDGTNTVQQTVTVIVTGAATQDPFVDLVTSDKNPVQTNSPVTLTATALSPAGQTLTYTWNFGDGTATATGNPVTHSYTAKGEYTVSVTVQDTSMRLGTFSDFTVFITDPSDPTNLVNGLPSTSPDGVQITVVPSPPGLLALDLALTTPRGAAPRGTVDFNTEFQIPGRSTSTVNGDKPVSRVNRSGVVVAKATGTDKSDTNKKLRGRKTIPVGAKDLGESPAVPDTLGDGEKNITATKLSGTFNFTSDKADKVSATFLIPLGAGYDLLRSQELSIGLSNVADRIVLDAKGKATGLADRGVLQKIAVKYPKGSNGVTLAGGKAQVTITFTAPNLDQAGFESDGITATGGGIKPLQIAIVLAGIPYSGTVNGELKVSKKGDKGALKLVK